MSSEAISTRSAATRKDAILQWVGTRWSWLEGWLERVGDRLNPILVKETRQAIKSSQFTFTFALVLIAVWIVTFVVSSQLGPGIAYAASGPEFFWWYQLILLFPLAVIVPFSAYRSLAAEREDNTYDLLSISTLTPRQIVVGKLGSAVVQMIVFLSAVAPCLAFTYLLRGIDVLTIFMLLLYTVLGSLGLSMIGLLLATSAKQRYGQVLTSVAFVAALIFAFIGGLSGTYGFIEESHNFVDTADFWMINGSLFTLYATTFAILFLAASAQLTFSSDNRSTALRIALFVQQSCFLGWMAFLIVEAWQRIRQVGTGLPSLDEPAVVVAVVGGFYWYFMGAMLTAERPEMSRRVQRTLPQSFLARALFTWFNPGPGTGYVFATANLLTIAVTSLGLLWLVGPLLGAPTTGASELTYFILIGCSYIVMYLGLGRLLLGLLHRWTEVPMIAAVLLHSVLVAAGCLVPMITNMLLEEVGYTRGYSLLHITNPFWTLERVQAAGTSIIELYLIAILVPAAAFAVFAANLRRVAREVRYVRTAVPARVAEDELQLHPAAVAGPQNPWEADESPRG